MSLVFSIYREKLGGLPPSANVFSRYLERNIEEATARDEVHTYDYDSIKKSVAPLEYLYDKTICNAILKELTLADQFYTFLNYVPYDIVKLVQEDSVFKQKADIVPFYEYFEHVPYDSQFLYTVETAQTSEQALWDEVYRFYTELVHIETFQFGKGAFFDQAELKSYANNGIIYYDVNIGSEDFTLFWQGLSSGFKGYALADQFFTSEYDGDPVLDDHLFDQETAAFVAYGKPVTFLPDSYTSSALLHYYTIETALKYWGGVAASDPFLPLSHHSQTLNFDNVVDRMVESWVSKAIGFHINHIYVPYEHSVHHHPELSTFKSFRLEQQFYTYLIEARDQLNPHHYPELGSFKAYRKEVGFFVQYFDVPFAYDFVSERVFGESEFVDFRREQQFFTTTVHGSYDYWLRGDEFSVRSKAIAVYDPLEGNEIRAAHIEFVDVMIDGGESTLRLEPQFYYFVYDGAPEVPATVGFEASGYKYREEVQFYYKGIRVDSALNFWVDWLADPLFKKYATQPSFHYYTNYGDNGKVLVELLEVAADNHITQVTRNSPIFDYAFNSYSFGFDLDLGSTPNFSMFSSYRKEVPFFINYSYSIGDLSRRVGEVRADGNVKGTLNPLPYFLDGYLANADFRVRHGRGDLVSRGTGNEVIYYYSMAGDNLEFIKVLGDINGSGDFVSRGTGNEVWYYYRMVGDNLEFVNVLGDIIGGGDFVSYGTGNEVWHYFRLAGDNLEFINVLGDIIGSVDLSDNVPNFFDLGINRREVNSYLDWTDWEGNFFSGGIAMYPIHFNAMNGEAINVRSALAFSNEHTKKPTAYGVSSLIKESDPAYIELYPNEFYYNVRPNLVEFYEVLTLAGNIDLIMGIELAELIVGDIESLFLPIEYLEFIGENIHGFANSEPLGMGDGVEWIYSYYSPQVFAPNAYKGGNLGLSVVRHEFGFNAKKPVVRYFFKAYNSYTSWAGDYRVSDALTSEYTTPLEFIMDTSFAMQPITDFYGGINVDSFGNPYQPQIILTVEAGLEFLLLAGLATESFARPPFDIVLMYVFDPFDAANADNTFNIASLAERFEHTIHIESFSPMQLLESDSVNMVTFTYMRTNTRIEAEGRHTSMVRDPPYEPQQGNIYDANHGIRAKLTIFTM